VTALDGADHRAQGVIGRPGEGDEFGPRAQPAEHPGRQGVGSRDHLKAQPTGRRPEDPGHGLVQDLAPAVREAIAGRGREVTFHQADALQGLQDLPLIDRGALANRLTEFGGLPQPLSGQSDPPAGNPQSFQGSLPRGGIQNRRQLQFFLQDGRAAPGFPRWTKASRAAPGNRRPTRFKAARRTEGRRSREVMTGR